MHTEPRSRRATGLKEMCADHARIPDPEKGLCIRGTLASVYLKLSLAPTFWQLKKSLQTFLAREPVI